MKHSHITILLIICLISAIFFSNIKNIQAQGVPSIWIDSAQFPKFQANQEKTNASVNTGFNSLKVLEELLDKIYPELGSIAFHGALGSALNKIAYDTATWIGSGGKGQKPLFIKEGWGTYIKNIGDEAAGTFIESLGKKWDVNLCQPDLQIKLKIGLGLKAEQRPGKPKCTFTEMSKNWEKELKSKDFLNKFQDMFNPTSNDLGIALTLQSKVKEDQQFRVNNGILQRQVNGNWNDVTSPISGEAISVPGLAESESSISLQSMVNSLNTTTQDPFVDAARVFVKQLMITLFTQGLANLGSKVSNTTSPYSGDYGLSDYNADSGTTGVAGVKDMLRKLTEPKFNVRGDYDILAELTSCPDPQKAGPTNCVINENFRQGITEKKTVLNAIKEGYLKEDGVFGYKADGYEPNYNDGDYPYRSMIILRKFRILPVGWEVAAQYIKDNPTQTGTCNLGDLAACFDTNDSYSYSSAGCKQGAWCNNLVDPNWVLKAPLNYCRREGAGPEIQSQNVTGEGEDSELTISRKDNYCADEQSCIKENADGSCEYYGYCTEERRGWNFGSDACNERFNTCQTFRSRGGDTVSYLENTLDHTGCSADNAGCKAYCEDFDYNTSKYACTAANGNKLYLDKDAEECDEESEGCSKFIRTEPGQGANLFFNSSFEDAAVFTGTQDCAGNAAFGNCSLNLSGDILPYEIGLSASFASPMPLVGESFTFSVYSKDCGANGVISIGSENWAGDHSTSSLSTTADWQRFSVTHSFKSGSKIFIAVENLVTASGNCRIDAIKVERESAPTAYTEYGESGVVHEKIIPEYLENECYVNAAAGNYELKSGYPAICEAYSRRCTKEEVNCEMYTSSKDGISVPAKVIATDYCAAECNGYNNYLQTEAIFDSARQSYFIPGKIKTCSAEAMGCDEFTNLDKVEQGGEAREYYTYLRQCIKTGSVGANCAEYYTWEGSSETGYQLRVHTFQQKIASTDLETTFNDSLECNDAIYHLPPSNAGYNPDCREYYDTAGKVWYHLDKATITCSENCHPYRRTENNIVKDIMTGNNISQAACEALSQFTDYRDINYNAGTGECTFCKNRGVWDNSHQACIYMAVPGEGRQCSAGASGCREYSGSSGSNIRIVSTSDFEGTAQGWTGQGGTTAAPDSESIRVSEQSLKVSGGAYSIGLGIGTLAEQDKSYNISFIAKKISSSASPASKFIAVKFENGANIAGFTIDPNMSLNVGSDWRIYKLNLASLNHAVDANEKLVITADGDFFIDDIRLTEVVDRYYLIKNSWTIPETCYQDIYGNPQGELYNLGCTAYKDSNGKTHYLRQFSQLCQDSAVGCELMVDTHNTNDYKAKTWNDPTPAVIDCAGDPDDCVAAAEDNFTYVVYNEEKLCNSSDKGCQRLGNPYNYAGSMIYREGYLKNDPDKYDTILCSTNALGCEAWTTDDGTSYFRDPGDMECEYRQKVSATEWGWWKIKVKRCDANSDGTITAGVETQICLKDEDCASSIKCIQDSNDYKCDTTNMATLGKGGTEAIAQPTVDLNGGYWAGLCPAEESGCNEYVDSVSQISSNLLFNPTFADLDNNIATIGDGWSAAGEQAVNLEKNTLYRLAARDNGVAIKNCSGNLYRLDGSNNLVLAGTNYTIPPTGPVYESALLYTGNTAVNCDIAPDNLTTGIVELKKAVISYQLSSKVDLTGCNGVVNNDDGCVLFNQRKQSGSAKASLLWDADLTINKISSPQAGNNDVNTVIKVEPDRVCDKWLACRSYVKDESDNPVCFDVGLCSSMDNNGNCQNYITTDKKEQEYNSGLSISNFSGYNKVAYNNSTSFHIVPQNLYPIAAMDQVGEVTDVPNGNFEYGADNHYPIGWTPYTGISWNKSTFSVIDNPLSAQDEGVGYPIEGRNYLKFSSEESDYLPVSEMIDVIENKKYRLTAYSNTINFSGKDSTKVDVGVEVEFYNSSGVYIDKKKVFTMDAGQDWKFLMGDFQTPASCVQVRIRLITEHPGGYCHMTDPNHLCYGNIYIDDIKLRPALEVKTSWDVSQTCRLYPQTDSLSCKYYDDSGKFQNGWLGYCLEYDRYPGSSDACLLWDPIDKVKGEGIEEGAGYLGKIPVYYCRNGVVDIPLPPASFNSRYGSTNIFWANQSAHGDISGGFTVNYIKEIIPGRSYEGRNVTGRCSNTFSIPTNNQNYMEIIPGNDGCHNAFSEATYSFELWDTETNEKVLYWSGNIDITLSIYITKAIKYCSDFSQTVSMTGQNKYWSARVYEGSQYISPCLQVSFPAFAFTSANCYYTTDATSFGSITPPGSSLDLLSNPFDWDSRPNEAGNQPLYYDNADTGYARMGSAHLIGDLQRIFAKSYGTWHWNGTNYVKVAGQEWNVPQTSCPGNTRPANAAFEYCGVVPIISNIKVNSATGNIAISSNQYINFTFNTKVDNQQLPLVMYAVDWGDDENTIVSGVEMRDRANVDNPHSLYHLYSYWDMRAKYNQGVVGITCTNLPGNNYCSVKPKVLVKDNWGWCNGDGINMPAAPNDCGYWMKFSGEIRVFEK